MDLQNLFTSQTTLHFSIIFIIFTTLIHKTQSVDSKFEACVPRNCGKGPNISYPFWIRHEQESYCGYPNFDIRCNEDNPVLSISSDDYVIRDIFYENHSFSLASAAFYEDTACPVPMHNFSLDRTPFHYSPSQVDLYFFYNCTSIPTDYRTYPVQCASNATLHSFAVFHKDALEAIGFFAANSCQSWVNAPLDTDGDKEFKTVFAMNYTEILKMGFQLNWTSNNCSKCERSGGRCGFDANEFICFCIDRPHHKSCDDGDGLNLPLKFLIGFGSAGISIMMMLVIFFIYQRRTKKRWASSSCVSRFISSTYSSSMTDLEKMGSFFGLHIFTHAELKEATNNFDTSRELGDGGFGIVYYGKLKDGRAVAVKRLYENNCKRVEQFMNEVEILARLRHQNLVSLYGCTSHRSQDLLLVYEYIPNGTVADHLHGETAKPSSLPWPTRLKIAIETASALAYLHASDIIHRDVKTNNILLDDNFCVKVADFGLSRLFPLDVTHVSTAPQGTPGYVDPDYHQCYQLTDKSDVYSFGVVLIELISSRPAVDITRHRHEINLSNMAINKIQNHALHELVDLSLGFESDCKVHKMMTAVAELAFQCLHHEKDIRPTMEEVLESLEDIQSCSRTSTLSHPETRVDKLENCTRLPTSQPLALVQNVVKAEEVHNHTDDVVLLKNGPLGLSPDSVTVKWISSSTTPNSSG